MTNPDSNAQPLPDETYFEVTFDTLHSDTPDTIQLRYSGQAKPNIYHVKQIVIVNQAEPKDD